MKQQQSSPESKSPARWRRWLLRVAVGVVVLAIVAWLVLPYALAPLIRGKLQALVGEHLNATLHIGSLRYEFPYGASARDVRLVANSDNVEVFAANSAKISLAMLPLGHGPLLIERLELNDPMFHVVRASSGALAEQNLMKHGSPAERRRKLSDILRLRVLTIHGGRMKYEDRSGSSPARPPDDPSVMEWDNLQTVLRLSPRSASQYEWNFSADSAPAAKVAADGTFDIDQFLLVVQKLSISAHADLNAPAKALPAQLQQAMQKFAIQGQATFDATARIPLRDKRASQFDATVRILDARASSAGSDFQVALQLDVRKQPNDSSIVLNIRDLSLAGSEFGQPLEHIHGTIVAANGELVAHNIAATIGQDQWELTTARAPMGEFSKGFLIRDIALSGKLEQPQPRYPRALGRMLTELNPQGPYQIRGWWTLIPHARDDYELSISTVGGAMAVTAQHVSMTNIHGQALLNPRLVQIKQFDGNVLAGSIGAQGTIQPRPSIRYDGEVALRNIDLSLLGKTFVIPTGENANLAGRCDARFDIHGQGTTAAGLAAQGEVHVVDGRLWEIPLLSKVAGQTKVARDTLTASEAAAVIDVADSKVHLTRAALNSPALGLQGSGTIGFDGQLDLDVIAAPLGDWKKDLKKTGIPLVSDVAGEIAGGIQKILNTATSQLLYQFHVTGKGSDPQVQTIPAPILSDAGAQLFEQMIKQQGSLLDALRDRGQKSEGPGQKK